MNLSNFGAVRHSLLSAAVLAFLAASASAQMVEKERTFADLTASHPCSSGYTGRNAIVTDCDAADDIGDGGGAFRCFAHCDGTAPWEAVSIGGGAGGGTGDVVGPASSIDNGIVRFDSTTGKLVQDGSKVTLSDVGDIQWEGATADAFEGNFTFADPTADWTWAWGATGNVTIPGNIQGPTAGFTIFGGTSTTADLIFQTTTGVGTTGSHMRFLVGNNGALEAMRLLHDGQAVFRTLNVGSSDGTDTDAKVAIDASKFYIDGSVEIGWGSGTPASYGYAPDTELVRVAAAVVNVKSALNLTPVASPPRTCDSTAEGDIYTDTSHALCYCDGAGWQVLNPLTAGVGTCS